MAAPRIIFVICVQLAFLRRPVLNSSLTFSVARCYLYLVPLRHYWDRSIVYLSHRIVAATVTVATTGPAVSTLYASPASSVV